MKKQTEESMAYSEDSEKRDLLSKIEALQDEKLKLQIEISTLQCILEVLRQTQLF